MKKRKYSKIIIIKSKLYKICTKCNKKQKIENFHFQNIKLNKKMVICKQCDLIRAKKYRKKNMHKYIEYANQYKKKYPKKVLNNYLKYKYNITLQDYNSMLKKQKFRCEICKKLKDKNKRSLGVDHNHRTGKVRGLLCAKCNIGIGLFEAFALKYKKYLKKYN